MEVLKAKYWVGTHDEVKKGGGLVSWILSRKVLGWKEAVQEVLGEEGENVRFEELGNGESRVLM